MSGGASPPPTGRKRGRPRDAAADGRILDAAAHLILERGFEQTTVDDVAALAGVGKATVYRRWPSKEDLAVAAMGKLYDVLAPVTDTGDLRADLGRLVETGIEFYNSPVGPSYLRMTIKESLRDPRIQDLYRTSAERIEQMITELLVAARERGEVRADADLSIAVQMMTGVALHRIVMGHQMVSVDQSEQMLDLLLLGLTGQPTA